MTTTDPAIQAQAAAILAELLSPVDTIDPAPVTMATLRERLPSALYGELRLSFIRAKALATSEAPADQIFAEEIADTQAALAGGGFLLHTPERLALLDQMAPALGWSAYLLAAMLRVCIITRPRWQTEGRPTEPTLETITAELEAAAAQAASAARSKQFLTIRERWIGEYGKTLRWINAQETGTAPPPAWSDLLGRLEG